MMNNKVKLSLLKKNFSLIVNNKLIYNQIILELKKKPIKFTRKSIYYLIMMIYIKRFGFKK